ncbi:MAG: 1,6-anhydro-N-acetylmuramyl-L-alanine amidase AmpD [Endozoicomonadaceae bacterium]|nr:1,6-anhydro-N-acetylmuramyl-L-alanine amidase AmpD [Endozoicomonadaceae bacterium]
MCIQNHWIQNIQHIPSPNYSPRPDATDISLLVIHCISLPPGSFQTGYIHLFFQNKLPTNKHPFFKSIQELKVSSHLLIERTGHIIQFVAFDQSALHAGSSVWNNRTACNDFSIGIELEGLDTLPYTAQQYQQLITVTKTLLAYYPRLSPHHITGHSNIAPKIKSDPGPYFHWPMYLDRLNQTDCQMIEDHYLQSISNGDSRTYCELLHEFIQTTQQDGELLLSAVMEKNKKKIKQLTHRLIGSFQLLELNAFIHQIKTFDESLKASCWNQKMTDSGFQIYNVIQQALIESEVLYNTALSQPQSRF